MCDTSSRYGSVNSSNFHGQNRNGMLSEIITVMACANTSVSEYALKVSYDNFYLLTKGSRLKDYFITEL